MDETMSDKVLSQLYNLVKIVRKGDKNDDDQYVDVGISNTHWEILEIIKELKKENEALNFNYSTCKDAFIRKNKQEIEWLQKFQQSLKNNKNPEYKFILKLIINDIQERISQLKNTNEVSVNSSQS